MGGLLAVAVGIGRACSHARNGFHTDGQVFCGKINYWLRGGGGGDVWSVFGVDGLVVGWGFWCDDERRISVARERAAHIDVSEAWRGVRMVGEACKQGVATLSRALRSE